MLVKIDVFCFYYTTLGSAVIPIEFQADQEGLYECHMLLKSGYDIRTIIIEASVSADEHPTQIEFRTQAIKAITQIIPVVSYFY